MYTYLLHSSTNNEWGCVTEEEFSGKESDHAQWMKRMRWSHSGLDFLDERLNALASLWAEGVINGVDFAPEVAEATQLSSKRPPASEGAGLAPHANNIRTAAGWFALLQVIHFCANHHLRTQEDRVSAFQLFREQLDKIGPSIGAPGRSWIGNVCEFRSQTEDAADPMHELVRRWSSGDGPKKQGDLIEESISLREPLYRNRFPRPDAPEAAVEHWMASLCADVQGLVLRETDAYCRMHGVTSQEGRVQAWREMVSALAQPAQQRSL